MIDDVLNPGLHAIVGIAGIFPGNALLAGLDKWSGVRLRDEGDASRSRVARGHPFGNDAP